MADTEGEELKTETGGTQEEEKPEEPDKETSPESTEEKSAAADHRETGKKGTMSKGEYLLITLAVLLIVIVIGGGMFIWARYGSIDGEQEAALERAQRPLYQLNSFFVPLKAQGGAGKFLRVTIFLELSGEGSSRIVDKQIHQIRGTLLQTLLSAVPRDIEYPHDKKALMDKMKTSVNYFLEKDLVEGIRLNNAVLL